VIRAGSNTATSAHAPVRSRPETPPRPEVFQVLHDGRVIEVPLDRLRVVVAFSDDEVGSLATKRMLTGADVNGGL
jgi:hypothetical protein